MNLEELMLRANIKNINTLSRLSGLSHVSINKYKKKGELEKITVTNLRALCKALNCKIEDLLDNPNELTNQPSEQTRIKVLNFPSEHQATDLKFRIDRMIDELFYLYQHGKNESKGLFTENEAMLIVDVFNATIISTSINPKDILLVTIKDSCAFFQLDEKWNVNKEKLIDTINNMNTLQAYATIKQTQKYWIEALTSTPDIQKIFNTKEVDLK
ncbi:MAG: helix-turn-helix domain-containing protein [Alkaliphilus sp.]